MIEFQFLENILNAGLGCKSDEPEEWSIDSRLRIEITILDIRGDQIKIGIQAPKEVPVYRKEIYLQIQKENEETMNTAGLEELKKLLG